MWTKHLQDLISSGQELHLFLDTIMPCLSETVIHSPRYNPSAEWNSILFMRTSESRLCTTNYQFGDNRQIFLQDGNFAGYLDLYLHVPNVKDFYGHTSQNTGRRVSAGRCPLWRKDLWIINLWQRFLSELGGLPERNWISKIGMISPDLQLWYICFPKGSVLGAGRQGASDFSKSPFQSRLSANAQRQVLFWAYFLWADCSCSSLRRV